MAGRIDPAGDIDYFRLEATSAGALTIETTGNTDTYGYLEDSSGAELERNDDSGVGTNFRIHHTVTPGTYYVRVRGYRNRTGNYTLRASRGADDDHGNTRATATTLPLNSPLAGLIDPAGDIDYFRLEATSAGALTVETTGNTDTYGYLEDSSGAELARNDDSGVGTNFRIVRDVTAGTYYIRVKGYGSRTTGSYTLNARFSGNANGDISLRIPEDFISDVVLANSTYFVLNAQYPTLMKDNDPVDFIYGKCTITLDFDHTEENRLSITLDSFEQIVRYLKQVNWNLDPQALADALHRIGVFSHPITIPDQPPYFMFPLLTTAEKLEDLRNNINARHLGSIVGSLVGLIPIYGDLASLTISLTLTEWDRLKGIDEIFRSVLDPKIILKPSFVDQFIDFFNGPGPPHEELRYLFYIPDRRVSNITVKVEQVYKQISLVPPFFHIKTAHYDRRLNLANNTWAAPSMQPMSLANYPPFQSLTPEVQDYLLRRLEEFTNFWDLAVESWQIPEETSLLPNYPNPFNPETWIPYQLSKAADVTLTIYDIHGRVVRALDLGHQRAGLYHSRGRAAYWDGRNAQSEPVASGVYFYTLKAGDFAATRKMLIAK